MHIPDGYLSPSTCATLYVFAASGWYTALQRIKRVLSTRTIPLISVFSAFSFVIMLFNIPLPGGTTGHAIGVGVAAIVLGPWGSVLALSIALAIQALFFGDGGLTTLGANCFNMAIVGSFVAYAAYRGLAGRSELQSRRRMIAAAIAGYLAVNASALVAAVEFGIQPALFHDAAGTPLYAPYGLGVAIPAMMIGHMTIAGFAEAAITAGMVSYLQKADAGLLQGMSGLSGADLGLEAGAKAEASPGRVWWVVGLLMLVAPIGVLATGTAWGEWSSAAFHDPQGRAQMAAASENHAPPPVVPQGLQKLSAIWTAPFPGYAPRFVKSPAFGYLLSAMFGVGFFLMISLIGGAAVRKLRTHEWST